MPTLRRIYPQRGARIEELLGDTFALTLGDEVTLVDLSGIDQPEMRISPKKIPIPNN